MFVFQLLGKRFPYEGPEIKAVCDVILGAESLSDPWTDGLLHALPFLARLPLLWGATAQRLKKNLNLVQEYYCEVPKVCLFGIVVFPGRVKWDNSGVM